MEDRCSICLDLLFNGEQFSALNCGHCLHDECLKSLHRTVQMQHQSKCPCCRTPFEKMTTGSQEKNLQQTSLENLSLRTEYLSLREKVEDYEDQIHFLKEALHMQTCKANENSLLVHQVREIAAQREAPLKDEILDVVRAHEAYKLGMKQRLSELEMWQMRKVAFEIEELASSSWEMISSDDYLREKAQNSTSKEDLIRDLAAWIAKTKQIEQQKQQLEKENKRLELQLRQKPKKPALKTQVIDLTRKPRENNVSPPPSTLQKRTSHSEVGDFASMQGNEASKKLKTLLQKPNTFYRGPSEKAKSLLNRVSDGRGNFCKVIIGL